MSKSKEALVRIWLTMVKVGFVCSTCHAISYVSTTRRDTAPIEEGLTLKNYIQRMVMY